MTPLTLVLALVISSCSASVDFPYSALYDIYDFVGKAEVPIPQCNIGCLIYASTKGSGFSSPSGFDPYAGNLIIHSASNQNRSITDLSLSYDQTTNAKKPLSVQGTKISILNLNSLNDKAYSPIVLYVIVTSKAHEFSYKVYDALNMNGITTNSLELITIMSAEPFTVTASGNWAENRVQARLVGFDNMYDSSDNTCPVVFSMLTTKPFPGYNLHVNGPIISLRHTERNDVTISAKTGLENPQSLSENGFITPAGYNGCRKPFSGGIQSFRSPSYKKNDSFKTISVTDEFRVYFDVDPNMDSNHKVIVNDVSYGWTKTITGYNKQSFQFDKTMYVEFTFYNMEGDQGFIIRYTSENLSKAKSAPTSTNGVARFRRMSSVNVTQL